MNDKSSVGETKLEVLPELPQSAAQSAVNTGSSDGSTAVLFLMTGMAKEDLDSIRFFVRNGLGDSAATFLVAVPNPVSPYVAE